jgi:hypothetical protein
MEEAFVKIKILAGDASDLRNRLNELAKQFENNGRKAANGFIDGLKTTISYFNDSIVIMNAHLGGLNIESVEGGSYYNVNLVLDSGKTLFDMKKDKVEAMAGALLTRTLGLIL